MKCDWPIVGGMEALDDVGSHLFSPVTKFNILQESAMTSNFAKTT
jgi:hypothetical protein